MAHTSTRERCLVITAKRTRCRQRCENPVLFHLLLLTICGVVCGGRGDAGGRGGKCEEDCSFWGSSLVRPWGLVAYCKHRALCAHAFDQAQVAEYYDRLAELRTASKFKVWPACSFCGWGP